LRASEARLGLKAKSKDKRSEGSLTTHDKDTFTKINDHFSTVFTRELAGQLPKFEDRVKSDNRIDSVKLLARNSVKLT